MTMGEYLSVSDAYGKKMQSDDRRMAYFTAWMLTPYSEDLNKTYQTIYYGLHPDDKPLPEEEKEQFCEMFNV